MMALHQHKKKVSTAGLNNISANLGLSRKAPSEKSFTSQKSHQSNQSNRSNNSKTKGTIQGYIKNKQTQPVKKQNTKRSSVYDSDT